MKGYSVMRSRVTGFGRRSVRAMLFGVAGFVPVVTMGLTVPSALGLRGAQVSYALESSRLEERSCLLDRLGDYTESGSVNELTELASVLRAMVPGSVRPLEEFALIRAIAARSGVDVGSIRSVRTHSARSLAGSKQGSEDVAEEGASQGIVIDEVVVTFNGGIDFCLQLVSTLRMSGYPIIVFGFDLARTQAGQQTFAVELRLGFLRRVGV